MELVTIQCRNTWVTDGKYAEDGSEDAVDDAQVLVPVVTRHAVVNDRHCELEDEQCRRLDTQQQQHTRNYSQLEDKQYCMHLNT